MRTEIERKASHETHQKRRRRGEGVIHEDAGRAHEQLELARVFDPALDEDYGRFVRYAYVLQCGLEV